MEKPTYFELPKAEPDLEYEEYEKTPGRFFRHLAKMYGPRDFLGRRVMNEDGTPGPYSFLSYEQTGKIISELAAGFLQLGLKKGDFLGLLSKNRAEWVLCEYAANVQGIVLVPVYDSQSLEDMTFVIGHAQLTTLVVSRGTLATWAKIAGDCGSVKRVVLMDQTPEDAKWYARYSDKQPSNCNAQNAAQFAQAKLVTSTLTDVRALGVAQPAEDNAEVAGDDLNTIMYTSGTTGSPKGALISNIQLVSSGKRLRTRVDASSAAHPAITQHVYLSFLPLAHIFERMNQQVMAHIGACVGFWQGEVPKLLDDIQALRPTVFAAVPRVYMKFYERIVGMINGGSPIKKFLFWKAYKATHKKLIVERRGRSSFWDRIVLKKMIARFGGRLVLFVCGSSPIPPHVAEFMHIGFRGSLCEGYGLTESVGMVTAMNYGDLPYGQVGELASDAQCKLESVPDLEYNVEDKPYPRGEIKVRGPCIFAGYFKDEEKTKEVFDDEGWFKTGDIGMFKEGRLMIIDRIKNIFKLAQGDFVCSEQIELSLKADPLFAQMYIYGNRYEAFLVGVVVPDYDQLRKEMAAKGLEHEGLTNAELCKSPDAQTHVIQRTREIGKSQKLKPIEIPAALLLEHEDFTQENNLLTPSFKLKRNMLKKVYETRLEQTYKALKAFAVPGKEEPAKVAQCVLQVL